MATTTPNYDFNLPAIADPIDEDLWGAELNANFTSLDSLLYETMPVGAMLDFAGTSAPTGFLLTYGQAVSRTTYSALFGVIGTAFGSGDGSTTFNLPDSRGRSHIGLDNLGGSSANRITDANADSLNNTGGGLETTTATGSVSGSTGTTGSTTISISEMPSHQHDTPIANTNNYGNGSTFPVSGGDLAGASTTTARLTKATGGGGSHNHSGGSLSATFTGNAVTSTPPWIALTKIIKY